MTNANLSRRSVLAGMAAVAVSAVSARSALLPVPPESQIASLARRKGVPFGSAIDGWDLEHPDLLALYKAHCTSLTPRNAMKWNATEKRRAVFNFEEADKLIAFAESCNMQVRGTALVWYRVPGNIASIDNKKVLDLAMRRHITREVTHFAGKVASWDVLNEPMEYDAAQMRQSVFDKLLGEDYIHTAFVTARQADPKAKLAINETHLEKRGDNFNKRRALLLSKLEKWKAAGTPIDTIGVQGHFRPGLDSFDKAEFGKFCSELKSMKIGVQLTEVDASCRFVHRDKSFTPDDYGQIFESLITTTAENAELQSVTVWGLSERYAAAVPREVTASCPKRVNLYDEDDAPRSTVAAIVRAYQALPDA